MTDLFDTLLTKLDEHVPRYTLLDQHFAGESPLSYLSPEARKSLGNRLQRVSVNIPRLLVEAVAERLRVVGFDGADVWPEWLACDLDQTSPVAHREALCLGSSYCIVWANPDGTPNASVESARQVAMLTDPGSRRVLGAVKRWETRTSTEATLFTPEAVTRLSSSNLGATTTGFRTVQTFPNPLGWVPVIRFANRSRLLEHPRSEMADVLDLSDALVKLMTDMLVSSEFTARPRRTATGIELIEEQRVAEDGTPVVDGMGHPILDTVNPFPETDRMLVSENEAAKFGQLPGSDLSGYENAIGVVMRQIAAVSGLPEHMLGIGGDNPTSADSIRASEAALTARAESRQAAFGRSWEQVAKLIVAVRDGVDPDRVSVRVQWADAATRSVAQEADAVTKLYAAGLLPASYALKRLGYTDDEIIAIRTARRTEALDGAGVQLSGLLP